MTPGQPWGMQAPGRGQGVAGPAPGGQPEGRPQIRRPVRCGIPPPSLPPHLPQTPCRGVFPPGDVGVSIPQPAALKLVLQMPVHVWLPTFALTISALLQADCHSCGQTGQKVLFSAPRSCSFSPGPRPLTFKHSVLARGGRRRSGQCAARKPFRPAQCCRFPVVLFGVFGGNVIAACCG